jgi:G3E family GTPase
VTGFLGTGKTTLVNYILKSRPENARVAVIENEVGEVNIDNSLVSENLMEKEDLVAMDKGCVCCSLRNDIVRALKQLYDNSEKKGFRYSAVVLETTGLADPAPVAFTFFSNHWIAHHFRLDSIICLVDGQHIRKHLEDASSGDLNEAVNQIAFADLILLNKIDLVSRKDLDDARDTIRSINITAGLLEVSLAPSDDSREYRKMEANKAVASDVFKHVPDKLSWDQIIGINSFSIERATTVDPCFFYDGTDESEG